MQLKKIFIGLFIGFGVMVNGLFALTINTNTTLSGTYNESITIDSGEVYINGDLVIQGNLFMNGGILELNGHNIDINGSFVQDSGSVYIEDGKLDIVQNYMIGTRESYTDSAYLHMENTDGYVVVGGDLGEYTFETTWGVRTCLKY